MAFLQQDKNSGRYRIRFDFGGQEYKRSIKTRDGKTARGIQARVEETIRLLEQGRLDLPQGADPAAFILSDGKLTGKPVVPRSLTLGELFTTYREKYPASAHDFGIRPDTSTAAVIKTRPTIHTHARLSRSATPKVDVDGIRNGTVFFMLASQIKPLFRAYRACLELISRISRRRNR